MVKLNPNAYCLLERISERFDLTAAARLPVCRFAEVRNQLR
jgi:hypothetical protein